MSKDKLNSRTLEDIYWHYKDTPTKAHKLTTSYANILGKVSEKLDSTMDFEVNNKLIRYIYRKIDDEYFDGKIAPYLESRYGKNLLCIKNSQLTKTAGIFSFGINNVNPTLEIGDKIIMKLFSHGEKNLKNGGLIIDSRLAFLIRTIEHELCHLITLLFEPVKALVNSGHGPVFKTFINHTFGHTTFTHDAFSGDIDIAENMKKILKLGNTIKYHGKTEIGAGRVISLQKQYVLVQTKTQVSYALPYGKIIEITDTSEAPAIDTSKLKVGAKVSFVCSSKCDTNGVMHGLVISFTSKRVKVSCDNGKTYMVAIWAIKYD